MNALAPSALNKNLQIESTDFVRSQSDNPFLNPSNNLFGDILGTNSGHTGFIGESRRFQRSNSEPRDDSLVNTLQQQKLMTAEIIQNSTLQNDTGGGFFPYISAIDDKVGKTGYVNTNADYYNWDSVKPASTAFNIDSDFRYGEAQSPAIANTTFKRKLPDTDYGNANMYSMDTTNQIVLAPPSDPNDPVIKPRRQHVRYAGDMYTPQWVRGQAHLKEGYCDLCSPGKWLQLKNSAYWYHKQFFHGISSVSGKFFQPPVQTRLKGGDVVEGLCHQCNSWVQVSSTKRRNSVMWFRHAHKCHVYHKPKSVYGKRR